LDQAAFADLQTTDRRIDRALKMLWLKSGKR